MKKNLPYRAGEGCGQIVFQLFVVVVDRFSDLYYDTVNYNVLHIKGKKGLKRPALAGRSPSLRLGIRLHLDHNRSYLVVRLHHHLRIMGIMILLMCGLTRHHI